MFTEIMQMLVRAKQTYIDKNISVMYLKLSVYVKIALQTEFAGLFLNVSSMYYFILFSN